MALNYSRGSRTATRPKQHPRGEVTNAKRRRPNPHYTFLAGVIPDFAGFLAVLFVAVSAQSSPQTVFASLQTLSHRGRMASSSLFAMLPLSLLGQVPRSAPVRRSWFRERDAKTKACLCATVSPAANPRGDGAAISIGAIRPPRERSSQNDNQAEK